MASINGISVRNVRDRMAGSGVERTATVYSNGTKIGFWREAKGTDVWSLDGPEKAWDVVLDAAKNWRSAAYWVPQTASDSSVIQAFLSECCCLYSLERDFKRIARNKVPGSVVMMVAIAHDERGVVWVMQRPYKSNNPNVLNEFRDVCKADDTWRTLPSVTMCFRGLGDFILSVGNAAPAARL